MAQVITQKEDLYKEVLIDPGALSEATTAYKNIGDVHTAEWLLSIGATDQITDMKLVQATSAAGAGVKDVPDAAITPIAATSDNKQESIEIDPYQLDHNNGFVYVAAVIELTGGTETIGHLLYTATPKKRPVTAHADILEQVLLVG